MFAAVLWVSVTITAQSQPLTVALLHKGDPRIPAAVGARVQADFREVLEHTGTVKLQGAADTALGVEEATRAGPGIVKVRPTAWRCWESPWRCPRAGGRSVRSRCHAHREGAGH